MPPSAASLARFVALAPVLLCLACHSAPAAAPAPLPETTAAAPAHTVPTDIKPTAAAAEPLASAGASCGGADHGSCCGSGQGDSACGQGSSCGQGAGGPHASCGGASDRLPGADDDSLEVLTRVADPSQVCMVRNHFMGRPQLAIQAEGNTYYGCCAGCANRLLQDARARQAVDPISHNPVDKGLAVLAKTSRGAVLYFENEANMQMFRATMQ